MFEKLKTEMETEVSILLPVDGEWVPSGLFSVVRSECAQSWVGTKFAFKNEACMRRMDRRMARLEKMRKLELELEAELDECCICYSAQINVRLQPCRHVALCTPCAGKLAKCPLCRVPIKRRAVVRTKYRAVVLSEHNIKEVGGGFLATMEGLVDSAKAWFRGL